MIKKIVTLAASAALLSLASNAYAAQPLNDSQMDGVTAGSVAIGNAAALALGEVLADTVTQTSTNVNRAGSNPLAWIVIGQAFSQSLASGGFLFQAGAVSHADTAAQWSP